MSDVAACRTCDGSGTLTVPDSNHESASEQACPDCQPDDDWEDEACYHDHDEECEDEWGYLNRCSHQHCFACGGCQCPGYCDDHQTYNLRPAETGGQP